MLRWIYFIALPAVIAVILAGLIYMHKDKATIVKTPPKELAQWYKPESKRHVWLHNMFKLRRELQAVAFYAQQENAPLMKKWAASFSQHYLKIAEMVPSWGQKLDNKTLNELNAHIRNGSYAQVASSVNRLQENCDSCHNDYQAITALTYRAPNFSGLNITPTLSFNDHMQTLTKQVNQVKISSQDNMPELALHSLAQLKQGMEQLGGVCVDCHKQDRKQYPSAQMQQTMQSLAENIKTGALKAQGRDLGTLAVLACAQCHGTHRLAFGAKELLNREPSLTELLKH